MYGNMAVKMAVVKNLVAVKGLQVAVNFDEGGSEGLPRSGNPVYCSPSVSPVLTESVPSLFFLTSITFMRLNWIQIPPWSMELRLDT